MCFLPPVVVQAQVYGAQLCLSVFQKCIKLANCNNVNEIYCDIFNLLLRFSRFFALRLLHTLLDYYAPAYKERGIIK